MTAAIASDIAAIDIYFVIGMRHTSHGITFQRLPRHVGVTMTELAGHAIAATTPLIVVDTLNCHALLRH